MKVKITSRDDVWNSACW